jgi:hypothetical protein
MSFKRPVIPLHIQHIYIYTWRNSPYFSFPLLAPLCSPFVSPSTYLAPSSCDRNRPPQSQVACKLTPFAPPFTQPTQPTPPLQSPRTPTAQRLTKTISGIFRLLLTGTLIIHYIQASNYILLLHDKFTLSLLRLFIAGRLPSVSCVRYRQNFANF